MLRRPLDELDTDQMEDFQREVKFMRSIRHPHLLIFYGAGVDHNKRAFLVTELMQGSCAKLPLLTANISINSFQENRLSLY